MRVILQKNVENLGQGGEIVRVRPGYARNFLIPRGLAAPATAQNLARAEDLKKQAAALAAAELAEAQALKAKLEATSIKLERAVGADNKMYGSVTSKDIEEAYSALGLTVDRKKIELAEPIKSLGLSDVEVRLHKEVVATLRVEVIKAG
ncbi:MAG: 50S ribosomal protein L9 [Sorangiineae bacterium NIC37A_2]|nr:MAG: 50S ribosomal protein L9 [Sorangiineae bacterium NIC37A_2]